MSKKANRNDANDEELETDYDAPPPPSDENIPHDDFDLPSGFRSLVAARDAAWWRPEPGMVIHGVFKGRFQRIDDANKYYYQLFLIAPTKAAIYDPNTREFVDGTCQAGKLCNVNGNKGLEVLNELLDIDDREIEVYIKAREKIKLKKGGKFWVFAVGVRNYVPPPTED